MGAVFEQTLAGGGDLAGGVGDLACSFGQALGDVAQGRGDFALHDEERAAGDADGEEKERYAHDLLVGVGGVDGLQFSLVAVVADEVVEVGELLVKLAGFLIDA